MDKEKGGAGRGNRRDVSRSALIILGIVVVVLIGVTVVTLVNMGKRIWGDVTGADEGGGGAVSDIVRQGSNETMPILGNTSPESVTPSTGSGGQGAEAPNPGNILSGADDAPDAKEASADNDEAEASADAEAPAEEVVANDENEGEASEVGAEPAEPVKKDSTPIFNAPVHGAILKGHDENIAVYSLTMGDYRVHLGVDIEANLGDPVYSCADGVVSQITEDPFMGVSVAISHSNGYVSFYKNLAPELAPGIKEGMAVTAGQIIGTVGETAAVEIADSSHLHFELTVDGVCVNPEDYIDFPQATAQTFGSE